MSLNPELLESITKNFPTMLNNFKKIGGWLVKGETEASPFPPAVKAFANSYDEHIKKVAGLTSSQTATSKQLTGLESTLAELKKSYAELQESYAELDERLNNLDEPAALAEPKPKTKSKAKPKVEPEVEPEVVEPTELEATAAAIGAGELSAGALAEVDDLLDSL